MQHLKKAAKVNVEHLLPSRTVVAFVYLPSVLSHFSKFGILIIGQKAESASDGGMFSV